jgi:NAD(P)-dependent dehydrogenase (short-subunit alcohol dehydrogenase family)
MQNELEVPDQFLFGRRIAITGAGRGLGRALAIVAADHGAETVLLGRDPAILNDVADTIKARSGRGSLVVPCDLAKPDSIATACAVALDNNPVIDVLINNGAPWLAGSLYEVSDADIISTVAAVSGTILITKGLLPGLFRSTAADIITIVSTSGVLSWDLGGGSVPFYAAKHGQSGFSDKLRHELKGTKIRVSAIYPPDFDDVDPTDSSWSRVPIDGATISSREIVSAVLFIMTTPRTCSFPVVIMDGMSQAES